MPPISSQRAALLDENPFLSDQDVGLLYQIITRAEQKPDVERLPFRAVFSAYDEVLAEQGVEADHDQVCMRFLFKMGSKGLRGDSLFDKFEYLLRKMGIVIEFDNSPGPIQDTNPISAPTVSQGDRTIDPSLHQREDTTQRVRRRRASFNSMYDVGDDATQKSAVRPSSRASMSRLEVGKPEFPESNGRSKRILPGADYATHPDRNRLLAEFLELGRRLMNGLDPSEKETPNYHEAPLTNGEPVQPTTYQVSMNGDTRHKPLRAHNPENILVRSGGGKRSATAAREIHWPGNITNLKMKPSLPGMLRDASAFNMYRKKAIARRILIQWLERTVRIEQRNKDMDAVAANRDRLTLLRQACDVWHAACRGKHQAAQTERFFKHLETRAARARELYLMTKAFTHWTQVTSDELSRTSSARQHILRIKYFSAWREITAVNELKAQRFALKRHMRVWMKEHHRKQNDSISAPVFYDINLKTKYIWAWFWDLCDRRAPRWYDYSLKRRSLICWLRSLRTQRERDHEIELGSKRSLLESALQKSVQKLKVTHAAQEKADSVYKTHLLRVNFDEWQIQSRLAWATMRVSDMVDKRVTKVVVTNWVFRTRIARQAREIDRLRVMGSTFTAWNDRLRCQALRLRIEERLKMETIYKWVLAERYRFFQQLREQRIIRDAFSMFVLNTREKFCRLPQREDYYQMYRRKELLRSKLDGLRRQLTVQRQRQNISSDFYNRRIQKESFAVWISKSHHIEKLEAWARDARFYFLTTKSIKKWHAASLDVSRKRREETYVKVRRKAKINLASSVLEIWRHKAQHVSNMEQQAVEIDRRKIFRTAPDVINLWHERTAGLIKESHDSDIYYYRQLAYRNLVHWIDVCKKIRSLEDQAVQIDHLSVSGLAMAQLRKLSLRIFQIRTSTETADAMNERILRKHFRSILRHWSGQAKAIIGEARNLPDQPTMEENGALTEDNENNAPALSHWPEAETTFNSSELASISEIPQATPIATPRYLQSPSKRTLRARRLAQLSTTPATPNYTPFASRLRAAIVAEKSSLTKKRNGRRSSVGASVRFVDEEPESPIEGRKSARKT